MLTIYLDGQVVRDLVNTGVDVTILTEIRVLNFPYWKLILDLPISEVGGQQDSKLLAHLVHWKDLDGSKGAIYPTVSTVPRKLWGRDIQADMSAVLTTDDRVSLMILSLTRQVCQIMILHMSHTPNFQGYCPSEIYHGQAS